jgi:aminopeptidase YwaD
MKRIFRILAVAFLCAPSFLSAQMTPWFQWTFLPKPQMDFIVGEASGETAFGHIMVMGGFPRERKPAEFAGNFRETDYILERLKAYGIADADVRRDPGAETWNALAGELWETSPGVEKIASLTDLRAMLAQGSTNADVTAEMVWIGEGRAKDLEGLDVKGKIVVTCGPVGQVHEAACLEKGAVGVVAFPDASSTDPLGIPWRGVRGAKEKPAAFAFQLPFREGAILRDRLKSGEKITARAMVRAESLKYDQQSVVASIPGIDKDGQEVLVTAHLFEGVVKQDANDNFSGCAAILEAARTIRTLIDQGRLPRPKRTIRFLWVPEISGSIAYVNAEKERILRTLCDINLDMVGLRLSGSSAFFTLMRTSYGNPHYVNDVMENCYRYVGETTRSYVVNGMSGAVETRIVAPSGSDEPMYYYMGTHFGSSDHEIFNDWSVGVPGVVMNTWPDKWYHTSQDRPDKIDPTQMKRASIITAAAAYTIAAADDRIAGQIAAEIVGNAAGRIGHQLARGLEEMKRADKDSLAVVYGTGRAYVEAAAQNERATLDSVRELASDKAVFGKYVEEQKAAVTGIEKSALATLANDMRLTAGVLGVPPVVLKPDALGKKAAGMIPKPTAKVREGGFGGYKAAVEEAIKTSVPTEVARLDKGFARLAPEIHLLCDGRNSALDIKKMLDTQYRRETSLAAILEYLAILKKAGLITI